MRGWVNADHTGATCLGSAIAGLTPQRGARRIIRHLMLNSSYIFHYGLNNNADIPTSSISHRCSEVRPGFEINNKKTKLPAIIWMFSVT